MKRNISCILLILMLIGNICGCGKMQRGESLKHIENMSSQEFVLTNADNSLRFNLADNRLTLVGNPGIDECNYIMIVLNNNEDYKYVEQCNDGSVNMTIDLPNERNMVVNLFYGKSQYGQYDSILIDFLEISKEENCWTFKQSPVLEANKNMFQQDKSSENNLTGTEDIQVDSAEIKQVANQITSAATDDYEKAKLLHDWVAENIYYDLDAFYSENYDGLDAVNVLHTKKGVCEGYANLYAALVRSLGIPCRKQSGYALGIDTNKKWDIQAINRTETNHAWNEVYVNNKWIIVDATWDSTNKYQNGNYESGNRITNLYFDSTLEFFSLSHKLIED